MVFSNSGVKMSYRVFKWYLKGLGILLDGLEMLTLQFELIIFLLQCSYVC